MALSSRHQSCLRPSSSHAYVARRTGVWTAHAVRPQLQGGTSSSAHQPELTPAAPGSQDDPTAVSNGLKAVSTASNGNGQTAQQPLPAVEQLQAASEQQQVEQLSIQQQQHADAAQQPETSSSSSLPAVAQKADTGWYYAVGLSAIAALICSVDRAAISVAILPMSEQYGWSDSTKGAINRWVGWRSNDWSRKGSHIYGFSCTLQLWNCLLNSSTAEHA